MYGVSQAIEQVCDKYKGQSLAEMGTALVHAYLNAKMRHVKESAGLYSVSSDVDGAAIAKAAAVRGCHAVAKMFATTKDGLTKDPEVIASMVLASLNGVARRLLEAKHPEREIDSLREELIVMVHGYLSTCAKQRLAA